MSKILSKAKYDLLDYVDDVLPDWRQISDEILDMAIDIGDDYHGDTNDIFTLSLRYSFKLTPLYGIQESEFYVNDSIASGLIGDDSICLCFKFSNKPNVRELNLSQIPRNVEEKLGIKGRYFPLDWDKSYSKEVSLDHIINDTYGYGTYYWIYHPKWIYFKNPYY